MNSIGVRFLSELFHFFRVFILTDFYFLLAHVFSAVSTRAAAATSSGTRSRASSSSPGERPDISLS
jgi:hypothetical protein